ncbi:MULTISPECIES: type III polyketide synthase [unclassified Streptomyces]|uniref:type III polyketide synthase n=1 Tax=unclassified Streptomyces TaxID=2593676 RepID=UPI00089059EA|nr:MULTISPECIES: type III polyketide synthase [unclassified Streptomyces]PBC72303.1 putative naringenin-chalcone synthase [Streptomyces sp. 2321.6]SDR62237.1 Predicted naringenin-chalcone synthase [Streptomyces sp. KS_16]SEE51282.1 Predicted naringenin-chalcone synthase [Streptomyces sp. 2133.1]SNC77807.1 Predicted naringenin-chalcone synthase [Streptomyces sp. 2114.4]
MPVHVTRPTIDHPNHWATTDDICDNITQHHPDHPKLGTVLRVIRNTGVQRRALHHPLESEQISGSLGVADRNQQAWDDASSLAETAAERALEEAGLQPSDITAIVTSNTTSWAAPGLDVHLVEQLRLRPDARRIALATVGCIGGAQALTRAADLVAAHPGARVLVVVSEALSTIYHHGDTSMESMIYKALFGDAASACIVTADQLQPGMRIDDTWEYLLPHSRERYWGRIDEAGIHFDSTRAATTAPTDAMPALRDWLKQHDGLAPAFAVIHAGGPAILNAAQKGLGLTAAQLTHSWASLAQVGNLGGASVLDVLRRTHDTPPADGDRGVTLAYGPGFATTALTGTWVS